MLGRHVEPKEKILEDIFLIGEVEALNCLFQVRINENPGKYGVECLLR
jgi:hypothetical protein